MKTIILIACLLGLASANLPYVFSDGYLEVLGGEPAQSFTCEGRPYGYYADVANFCQVFHICLPLSDEDGSIYDTFHYSFFCGNQTVFSQESLTCVHPADSFPCEEAESIYELSNADFGRIPEDNEIL
ncbi:UNVERIFIED_CONTAM: hypothetical protein RMT77_019924 [Armadillidium vulgare]